MINFNNLEVDRLSKKQVTGFENTQGEPCRLKTGWSDLRLSAVDACLVLEAIVANPPSHGQGDTKQEARRSATSPSKA
jgi:hypothetical protein